MSSSPPPAEFTLESAYFVDCPKYVEGQITLKGETRACLGKNIKRFFVLKDIPGIFSFCSFYVTSARNILAAYNLLMQLSE